MINTAALHINADHQLMREKVTGYPPEIRKVINHSSFPTDGAVIRLLHLASNNIGIYIAS